MLTEQAAVRKGLCDMEKKYVLDGYSFSTMAEYERAKKEKETIAYVSANTDMSNMKEVYKVYKLAVEKKSFQTVFGLEYMQDLRSRLVGSGIIPENVIEPVPVGRPVSVVQARRPDGEGSDFSNAAGKMGSAAAEREIKKYQEAYQKAKAGSIIKNFLIVVLVLVVGAMLYITSKYQYSILTYFTDYEAKIRNEIVDEYEEWEKQLDEREKELERRQAQ